MKVILISPNPSDGTSWYRSNGPLSHMMDNYDDFQYVEYGGNKLPEWDVLIKFDVLFLQRPYRKDHYVLANKMISLGKKVWIDWDDLLWAVPPDNPTHYKYSTDDVQEGLQMLLSDLPLDNVSYSVTTPYLKKILEKISDRNMNIHVIPNALDERMFLPFHQRDPDGNYIAWRGSDTHVADVLKYRDVLNKIIFREPTTWDFIGMNPWFLDNKQGKIRNYKPGGVLEYFKFIQHRNWKAWVCMLDDNPFNRCKSDIMYLEAAFAGAVLIAPDWEEFERPGCLNYRSGKMASFESTIFTAMVDYSSTELLKEWKSACEYIEANRTLKVINPERYKLLTNLINN